MNSNKKLNSLLKDFSSQKKLIKDYTLEEYIIKTKNQRREIILNNQRWRDERGKVFLYEKTDEENLKQLQKKTSTPQIIIRQQYSPIQSDKLILEPTRLSYQSVLNFNTNRSQKLTSKIQPKTRLLTLQNESPKHSMLKLQQVRILENTGNSNQKQNFSKSFYRFSGKLIKTNNNSTSSILGPELRIEQQRTKMKAYRCLSRKTKDQVAHILEQQIKQKSTEEFSDRAIRQFSMNNNEVTLYMVEDDTRSKKSKQQYHKTEYDDYDYLQLMDFHKKERDDEMNKIIKVSPKLMNQKKVVQIELIQLQRSQLTTNINKSHKKKCTEQALFQIAKKILLIKILCFIETVIMKSIKLSQIQLLLLIYIPHRCK